MNMKRFLAIAVVAFTAGPALAQSLALPTAIEEEVTVKTSLLTLNDGNLTGNYTVMHARMAKAFREKFGPETLKRAFKEFAGKHIDAIAAKPIVPVGEAIINGNGTLMLRGYFDTTPSRLIYELDYALSEGEWKLINIDVKVRNESLISEAGGIGLLTHTATDLSAAAK